MTTVTFDGVELKNVGPLKPKEDQDNFEITIECLTDDYTDIDEMIARAGKATSSKLLSGKTAIQTTGTSGTLVIGENMYTNCVIMDGVQVEEEPGTGPTPKWKYKMRFMQAERVTAPVIHPLTFLPGWSYRKLHIIANISDPITDYQIKFKVWNTTGTDSGENVYLGNKVTSDFRDIRFTTINNTVLPYWIEEIGTNYAIVWVKISLIPITGTQVYLYYGNPSTTSLSNGDDTFSFFDHFLGSSLDTDKWTVSLGGQTLNNSILTTKSGGMNTFYSTALFGGDTILRMRANVPIIVRQVGAHFGGNLLQAEQAQKCAGSDDATQRKMQPVKPQPGA